MTQPPLGGISGTKSQWSRQVCLHLKHAARVAVKNCAAPRHHRAVFLHGGKGTQTSNDVANTVFQLGLHFVGVTTTSCAAPCHHRAVVKHCSERCTHPVCVYTWKVHHQNGDDVAVCEIAGRTGQGVRHAVARRRQQNTPRGGHCKLTTCCVRHIADRAVSTQKEVRDDLLAASELHCQSGHGSCKSDARKKLF